MVAGRQNPLVGKIVTDVFIAGNEEAIRFGLLDGLTVVAKCDAECCSKTWIESIEGLDTLIGHKVISVEDIDFPEREEETEDIYTKFYGLKILTDQGACVLDYRNESNGYYGGDLKWPGDYDYDILEPVGPTKDWKPLSDT